jgi:hypothetical protein
LIGEDGLVVRRGEGLDSRSACGNIAEPAKRIGVQHDDADAAADERVYARMREEVPDAIAHE